MYVFFCVNRILKETIVEAYDYEHSESVAKFDQRSLRIFYLFIDIIIRLCAMGQNWSRDS